ncbi:MAG TPA: N-acetylmuramoyl-L-alanine amidase [Tissierellaceae bacterium]|nr:N-acetylmuramoyl-L-alanine amidase [Tissierellaceae bacterium]
MQVRKMLLPTSKYKLKAPYNMKAEWYVVHNTANDASANNEINYMTSNDSQTSFHYAIDDKEIVQGIEENRNAWHAGKQHCPLY